MELLRVSDADSLTIICKTYRSFVVSILGYINCIEKSMKTMKRMLAVSIIFTASSAIAGLIQLLLLLSK